VINIKKLHTRFTWKLTLRTLSPLHIGENREESSSEIFPLMNVKEYSDAKSFVIPGSTLRGLFRGYLNEIGLSLKNMNIQPIINDLFGHVDGNGLKGRVWIGDTKISKSRFTVKHLTPIDRITHTPIAPLQVYAIRPGTDMSVNLTLENPNSYELGLVALFLRALSEEHLAVGSGVSRGMGRVKLLHTETTLLSTQKDKLQTEDQVDIPIQDWQARPTLLGKEYFRSDSGTESFQWMQAGATELKNKLMKEVSSS